MAGGPTRRLMLVGRFLELVPASKGRRLTGRGAFELFDALLKRTEQLLHLVKARAKGLVVGFELLDAKVAWIGVHAQLQGSRGEPTWWAG
jgi:hypothetical protein